MLRFFKNPLPYVLLANILLHVWRYLGELAAQGKGMGFSSDDAWIHLAFARNFARHFEFAFTTGVPSTGSTAPLWSLILSIPHFFSENVDFIFIAVTALTVALFLASAVMLYLLVMRMFGNAFAAWAAALLFVNEWHMIWAALSGMEIMLFIFLELALIYATFAGRPRPVLIGLLGGLLFLTRPEGVLLFALAAAVLFFRFRRTPEVNSLKKTALACIVALCVAAPALIYYLAVDGSVVPNTFHAKGAFYEVAKYRWTLWDGGPGYISTFMGDAFHYFGAGYMAFLLPWFIAALLHLCLKFADERRIEPWGLLLAWWFIFLAAYAWKLPKGFQCGRYIMPATPMFIALCTGILFTFGERLKRRDALVIFEALLVGGVMFFVWPEIKNVERSEYVVPFCVLCALFALYVVKIIAPKFASKRIPILRDSPPPAPGAASRKKSEPPPDKETPRGPYHIPDDVYGFLRCVLIFAVVAFALQSEWSRSYPEWNGTDAYPTVEKVAKHIEQGGAPADKIWDEGRNAFIWWVLFINEQHIPIGNYIRENTPADAIIATHDIGAVAYFSDRPVVDVIGLVTPDMMEFCHNHDRMKKILAGVDPLSAKIIGPYGRGGKKHADYFALFTQKDAGFYEFFADENKYPGFLTQVKEEVFLTRPSGKSVFSLCKINAPESK
jgi:4-amino-4-deoxy-L-arabinose transferase-like glycosyltransferase